MYRDAGERAAGEAPSSDFVYEGVDRGGKRNPGLGLLQLFALPACVAALCARMLGPAEGLIALVATGILAWYLARHMPKAGLVLRVASGELLVFPRRREKKPKARIRLGDLLNVALDTKTIQRVEEGGSAIPAMRFLDSKVSAEADISRIVLVRRGGSDVPLTDNHLVHMDATESLGKIRVFLRKHGWVPADEREPADDVPDSEAFGSDLESEMGDVESEMPSISPRARQTP
jgi:hypothetical protein